MRRFHGLLRALVVMLLAAGILPPLASPALAGVTIAQPTSLLAEPSGESAPVAEVPAGAAATIDGEPVGAWYPVTVDGVSGWVIGHALAVEKDPAAPLEDAPGDPASATPVPAPETEPAATAIGDAPATSVPAAEPTAPAAPPATEPPSDPVAQDAAATEPASGATPAPADPTAAEGTATAPESTETAAPPSPSPSPAPQPTAAPEPTPASLDLNGAATVTTDASLLEWAGQDAPLVFTVPTGSTVNLQGERANGYVHAEFFWMFGWIREDLLEPAAPVAEEAIPEHVEEAEVKTPKAGAGMARTTVDLSLRAGPSATEEVLAMVPADTKVELTGVMQNEFQRVIHGELVGWLANAYLELPQAPEPPPAKPNGKPHYTERQIVRIIEQAADRYGQSREDMLRVARCESNLDPYAVNPSGSYGLFQFIRSTWESTPFADEDVFDPEANANAAGWMWQQGRRAEWVCQ